MKLLLVSKCGYDGGEHYKCVSPSTGLSWSEMLIRHVTTCHHHELFVVVVVVVGCV